MSDKNGPNFEDAFNTAFIRRLVSEFDTAIIESEKVYQNKKTDDDPELAIISLSRALGLLETTKNELDIVYKTLVALMKAIPTKNQLKVQSKVDRKISEDEQSLLDSLSDYQTNHFTKVKN